MRQSIHSRAGIFFSTTLAFAFAATCLALPSAVASEPDDEPPWLMSLGPVDLEPQHEFWGDGAATGSLWLSVQATFVRTADGRNDFAAMAMLGVPLERLGRSRDRPMRVAERVAPALPNHSDSSSLAPAGPLAPTVEPSKTQGSIEPVQVVTPSMARAAIAAALEHARLDQSTSRVDRLASRARTSALLPELRLRVTRQLDDSQGLSPTEYDPDRVTATVKASWWFEARATFKLDKLVFADEEVALERMREERIEAAKKLRERVLGTLFAWQRALRTRDDPTAEPEVQTKASFDVVEAEVTLDVLTGGWFSRWKVTRVRSGPN